MTSHWTAALMGARCPTCGYRVPKALATPYHPTCWPQPVQGITCPSPAGFASLGSAAGLLVMTVTPFTWLPCNVQLTFGDVRALAGSGTWTAGDDVRAVVSSVTEQQWPTILPGTPG